jgi:hypothetical protein
MDLNTLGVDESLGNATSGDKLIEVADLAFHQALPTDVTERFSSIKSRKKSED